MTDKWLHDFTRILYSRVPSIEANPEGSTMISMGDYNYYRNPQQFTDGYKDIHCYIEQGMGLHHDEILKTLERVHAFMNERDRESYDFNMYWFGSINDHRREDHLRKFLRQRREQVPLKARVWTRILCTEAGNEPSQDNPYIPRLSHIDSSDLALVFTSSSVTMNCVARFIYQRNRRHFFWFFLDGPELVFVHGSKFQPNFVDVEPQGTADQA